jgi:outer membrane protein assembly factor BamB
MRKSALFLWILTIVLLSPATMGSVYFSEEWSMFWHDPERTGYSTSAAPGEGDALWVADVEGGVMSSAAIYSGRVYVGWRLGTSEGAVYGFDAFTGDEIWRFDAGPVSSSPAVTARASG